MSVLFALASAALFGLSDFIGGLSARRSSVWPVGFLAAVAAVIGAGVLALLTTGDPSRSDLIRGLAAGLGAGTGTVALYRGLAGGRMGVVAPISAVGAVLIPLAVGLADGERPAPVGWLGILLAVPGIWLVAREEELVHDGSPAPAARERILGAGVPDGVLAGIGFGVMFALMGGIDASAGYWPLTAAQASSVVVIGLGAAIARSSPWPSRRAHLGGLAAGVLATLAVVSFLLATHRGLLSIAAVLSSLYPAFTVALAIGLLGEPVHRAQRVGLALCTACVVCVSLA